MPGFGADGVVAGDCCSHVVPFHTCAQAAPRREDLGPSCSGPDRPCVQVAPGDEAPAARRPDCTQNFEIWALPKASTQTLAPSNASIFAWLKSPNVPTIWPVLAPSS